MRFVGFANVGPKESTVELSSPLRETIGHLMQIVYQEEGI